MSEPSLQAKATMRELELLAVQRARESGRIVAVAAFVDSDRAHLVDVNGDEAETVELPQVRQLYP